MVYGILVGFMANFKHLQPYFRNPVYNESANPHNSCGISQVFALSVRKFESHDLILGLRCQCFKATRSPPLPPATQSVAPMP